MSRVIDMQFKDGEEDFDELIGASITIRVVQNGFIIETLHPEEGLSEEVAQNRVDLFALIEENLNG